MRRAAHDVVKKYLDNFIQHYTLIPEGFFFTIVCSLKPIEANYCSNPFGIFFLKNMPGLWPNLSVEIFMEVHFYNHVNKSTFKSALISGTFESASILCGTCCLAHA